MTETQGRIDLVSLIPEWLREAESFEEQSRVLEGKARALRQMVESVQVLNGDAGRLLTFAATERQPVVVKRTNRFDPADGPRGRAAVRLIVGERPGIWKLREIVAESKRRGWPSSRNALSTAVARLQQDGEAEWVSKGVYSFDTGSVVSALVTGDTP
jgi:hypothetical protein